MEDLKAFYTANFAPNISTMHIVGAIDQAGALRSMANLENSWAQKVVETLLHN